MLASLADSTLDLATSVFTLLAVRYAAAPPDREHRFGHGKAEAFAGLERIREIRNEATEDEGEASRHPLPRVEGRIEFRDVQFEYKAGTPVLKGISFVAEPGTSTALVGPSGSGQSTMIGLVADFHRPTAGQVLVDGKDLRDVRLGDYRSHLGVVFQENFLFDGTVLENIAYAQPHATEEEVLRAAKIAHCDDFAQRLRDLIETNRQILDGKRLHISRVEWLGWQRRAGCLEIGIQGDSDALPGQCGFRHTVHCRRAGAIQHTHRQ